MERDRFKEEGLSLTDSDKIEGMVDTIAASADDSFATLTAFRDHLLDDLAHNYHLKHHLDDETIEKIRDSASDVKEAGIDLNFKEKVEERLQFAIKNAPKVNLRGASSSDNPYQGELKKILHAIDPDKRKEVEDKVVNYVKSISPANLLKSEEVKNIIKKFKDEPPYIYHSVPYVVLNGIMDAILDDFNVYLDFAQNENTRGEINKILDAIANAYSEKHEKLNKIKL